MIGVEMEIWGLEILVENSITFIFPSQYDGFQIEALRARCKAVQTMVQSVNLKCMHYCQYVFQRTSLVMTPSPVI